VGAAATAQATAEAAAQAAGTALDQSSFKNLLINGDFVINQRSFAGGALSAGAYGYDRWKAGTGGCNVTLSGGILTHTSGPLVQVIEAPRLAGKTVTVSVEDPSGSITVNVDGVTGTITSGSGRRGVSIVVPSGSTGNVTLTLTATGVTYTRVQLEVGASATQWDARPIAIQLTLCQRYCERVDFIAAADGASFKSIYFKVNKRGNPALTLVSGTVAPAALQQRGGYYFSIAGLASSANPASVLADSEL
jgi:hypothetical protein